MAAPFESTAAASLPADALPALANLRTHSNLEVAVGGGRLWLRFPCGDAAVLHVILPLMGLELYERRGDVWHRFGRHLPSFGFPEELEYRPLAEILFPSALDIVSPPATPDPPLTLSLIGDAHPRPATAARCSLPDLGRWADQMPAARLAELDAVRHGNEILLRGRRLPPFVRAKLYWGQTLLIPLGLRPEPEVPDQIMRAAFALEADDLLLWESDRLEAIPAALLQPLTRAALRLACAEIAP
jgi:hypothetical protein